MAEPEPRRRAGPKGPGRSRGTDAPRLPRSPKPPRPPGPPRSPRSPSAARIVLASVGPAIPPAVITRLAAVAQEIRGGAEAPTPVVHIVSIARIWGTSFGLPNPGLYPNRVEIEEQREIVDSASAAVGRLGFGVKSRILSARHPDKTIAAYAERIGARAIVVGDPAHGMKPWERVIKGNPVRDLSRRTRIPVHSVPIDAPMPRGMPQRRHPAGDR